MERGLGLKCYCDICPNHTCETDGICFATTTKSKKGALTHQYRCIPKEELTPPDNPISCHHSNNVDDHFAIECCRGADYCNLNIVPTLSPSTVEIAPADAQQCAILLDYSQVLIAPTYIPTKTLTEALMTVET
uniref:TGF-beta receptor type-1 n=1 Tax=Rhipicephalus appendiculatus TaxID=34631 RepID=A0A131YYH8_RHIAP